MSKQFTEVTGLRIRGRSAAPSDLQDGDLYYDTTAGKFKQQANGSVSDLGSGGSGTGDDLNALQYRVSFSDDFSDPAGTGNSSVDTSAGHTNATYNSTSPQFFAILYDASKTVTGTGTSMTLSGTPSYTVVAGDILRVGTEARRITVVTTQTSYTIESAFATDPSAAAATVSQAVYTKDINNLAVDGVTAASQYSGSLSDLLLTYNDTTSGSLYNGTDPANVGFTASADGTTYTLVQAREAVPSTTQPITSLSTAGTNMYIRFFSNKTSGSGTVNLFKYRSFFNRETSVDSANIQWQAYAFLDGTGTPVNCSLSVVNSKTRVTFTGGNTYPVGVATGNSNGPLRVFINGQKIPRFINSTLTPNASYTEVSASVIDLDTDYSQQNIPIEVILEQSVVDSNTQNTTNIATINTHLFRNYAINGNFDFWQRGTSFSTPSSGSYTADRWRCGYDGTSGTFTVSRQAFALGQANVPNEPTYYIEWNQTVASSGSTIRLLSQRIESVRTLAGKQATVSFWAKADTTRTLGVAVNQGFGTGGSPSASVTSATQNASLTTSWQKFTFTFSVPSISGKTLGTNGDDIFEIQLLMPLNTTMTIDIAQIMVNEGASAAPWVYASGGSSLNFEAELALCQRYYEKSYNVTTVPGSSTQTSMLYGVSRGHTTTSMDPAPGIRFLVTKRAAPTMVGYSTAGVTGSWTTTVGDGTVNFSSGGTNYVTATITGLTGVTVGTAYYAFGHWTAEAEL